MVNIEKIAVQKQEDVMHLRDRVDYLDSQQQQQWEELRADPPYVIDRISQLPTSDHRPDSLARSDDSDRSDS